MSTNPPLAQLYHGEPRPRQAWIALVVTLLCPGMSALYFGSVSAGILICTLYVIAAGLFVLAWSAFKFFPLLPLLVLVAGASLITLMLAIDAARRARRVGEGYTLRSGNNPILYVLICLAFYFLPLAGLIQFTNERLWSVIAVDDQANYPTLVPGDYLLVDRTAYLDRLPVAGELIVYRAPNGLHVGRVVGGPGDEVQVNQTEPWINGDPLPRAPVTPEQPGAEVWLAVLQDVPMLQGFRTYAEEASGIGYLISEGLRTPPMIVEPLVLGQWEYFVMNDNRSHSSDAGGHAFGDSRDLGPINHQQILGQPLYIAYSSGDEGVRWQRVAKRVQPVPVR
jgi:signal peptidase I